MKALPPPVAMLLCLALAGLARWLFPALSFSFSGQVWLGLLLIALVLVTEFTLIRQFRAAKTSFTPIDVAKARHLVTSGLFAYTRNPMYVGQLLILLSGGIAIGSWALIPLWALFFTYLNKMQIPREEAALHANFGQEYADYCQRVRRWA